MYSSTLYSSTLYSSLSPHNNIKLFFSKNKEATAPQIYSEEAKEVNKGGSDSKIREIITFIALHAILPPQVGGTRQRQSIACSNGKEGIFASQLFVQDSPKRFILGCVKLPLTKGLVMSLGRTIIQLTNKKMSMPWTGASFAYQARAREKKRRVMGVSELFRESAARPRPPALTPYLLCCMIVETAARRRLSVSRFVRPSIHHQCAWLCRASWRE